MTSNLDIIVKYKLAVRKWLGKSPGLLDLLFDKENAISEVEDQDIDQVIIPCDYCPDTITKARAYVGFEVDIPRIIDGSILEVFTSFFVLVHKDALFVPFRTGLRSDLIASEIDKIMNGNDQLGIGRCELKRIERYRGDNKELYCRGLLYVSEDFNRGFKRVQS